MKPRQYILDVLIRVFQQDGYASLIMREAPFSSQDMGFISEVVFGTIRHYEMLEYQWRSYVKGHVKKKIALIIDMSLYQLLYLDGIPDYAVINEAVELSGTHEKKFVNAILRNIQKRGKVYPHLKSSENLSIETSTPLWLVKLWEKQYGEEIAAKICHENLERAYVFGRINTLKISKEELEKGSKIRFVNEISFIYDGILSRTSMFTEGNVVIQDINSAQTVTYLDVKPDQKVLDLCAAPGTKSQEIAMFMKNQGEIISCDLYEHRLGLIDTCMKQTGVTICKTMLNDARKDRKEWHEAFDRILVDAPCSGLGDLKHKPEIKLHIKPENLDEIIKIQKEILNTASQYLKPNGIMVYSTCTLNKKENENQIKQFLAQHTEFHLLEDKTIFPFENGGDGFYMAKLVKRNKNESNEEAFSMVE